MRTIFVIRKQWIKEVLDRDYSMSTFHDEHTFGLDAQRLDVNNKQTAPFIHQLSAYKVNTTRTQDVDNRFIQTF